MKIGNGGGLRMNVLEVCEHIASTADAMGEVTRAKSQVIKFKPQEALVPAPSKEAAPEKNDEILINRRDLPALIKVISAGGGGANALNRMIDAGIMGVEFIATNTDLQALIKKSRADVKVQIGAQVTGGHGAGGDPDKGELAAIEDQVAIAETLKGADMVFITSCMGGGTGTGSAPIIAKIARQLGALTVAVVTIPFEFEGRYKMRLALNGIEKLREEVDTLIVIPNQHLFKIIDNKTSWDSAFLMADEVLCRGVKGISDIITKAAFCNTDFADVKTIMKGKGDALMGIGVGSGDNRALDAVMNAIDNPLLEDSSIEGATSVLVHIAGPEDVTLIELGNIVKTIMEKCDPDVHIIQGLDKSPDFGNSIEVTIIATGFAENKTPAKQNVTEKAADLDFINYDEYVRMLERINRNEDLQCLPPRGYQDVLNIPAVYRKHYFMANEKSSPEEENVNLTERQKSVSVLNGMEKK